MHVFLRMVKVIKLLIVPVFFIGVIGAISRKVGTKLFVNCIAYKAACTYYQYPFQNVLLCFFVKGKCNHFRWYRFIANLDEDGTPHFS